MKWSKKITSIALAFCVFVSAIAIGNFSVSAVKTTSETVAAPVDSDHPELAQETVQGSAILHCFCWSFDQIRANLSAIKAAGYTAVQTSPVQPPKDYNVNNTTTKDEWWKLYQPLDLAITNGTNYNSWLGTKQQLTQLCTEAHNNGIKVIVDIVANHVANDQDNTGTFQHIHADVATRLRFSEYYHNIATPKPSGSTNRYELTHYHIGMPDLNTENIDVQNFVIGLCEECIDCGVDGFRFDTAKAIEVPNDPEGTRSDFWPNVTSAIKTKKSDAFIYGEILSSTCTTKLTDYTTYMKLTDDGVGYTALLNGTKAGNAENLANAKYSKKANDQVRIAAEDSIIWAESHDTYMNTGKDNSTDQIPNQKIVQTWAIVGARSKSTALYFVRPNATMGLASTDTTWKSTPVAEVNKFKNLFDGKSEALSYNSTTALLERGKKGAVISKISGGSNVSISVQKMVDGTYLDHVSGTNFTVSNGVLTGTVDSSGVAVIYNANDIDDPVITASKLYLSPKPGWTLSNNRDYAMYLFNDNTEASQWVSMTAVANTNGEIFSGVVPNGQWTGVIFVRKDSSLAMSWDNNSVKNQTVDLFPSGENDFFTVAPAGNGEKNTGTWSVYGATVDDTPDSVTNSKLYLDCSLLKNSNGDYWWVGDGALSYAYFFNSSGNQWERMSAVENESYIFEVTIPSGNWTKVIFARMNPTNIDTVENKWNNKWNQTDDLNVPPTSGDSRCFQLKKDLVENTDKQDGEWIVYPSTHTYTPTWTWSSDNSTATLTLGCTCGRTVTFEKSVTPVSDEDKDVFTAMVRYQGEVYSDTHTVYKRPTFTGYKLALDGKIGIIYYVDFHNFTPSGTMTFTRENSTSSATLTQEDDGSTVYRATCYVAAKEMGDRVTASVTADETTATNTYSVKEYLERIIKNENGEAGTEKPEQLQALARSMLNYGAKAQLQFGYKTNELVNAGYENYTPESPSGLEKLTYFANQFTDYGLKFAGSSLLLTDSTTLRLFFSKDENYDSSTTTLSCNGKTLSPGSKGNYITFDITGIAAPDVLDNQTVTFSKGSNSLVAEFCIRNYISNKYNTGGTLGDVVTALHDYSVKASAYFKGGSN